jgi:hypothetical protein
MKVDPDTSFTYLSAVIVRLGISLPFQLTRQNLPAKPDPNVVQLYEIIKLKVMDQKLLLDQEQALQDEEGFAMASNTLEVEVTFRASATEPIV